MKLIVGLGNPGNTYNNTRHNIGFMFIDYYLNEINVDVVWKKKFDGLYYKININGNDVIFLKPQTFMNLSGISVRKVIDYFNIKVDDIIVISDDLDLNLGNFKLKSSGSSGGHNGLKSIEQNINTNQFKRLKIGSSNNKMIKTKDYVLNAFSESEKIILDDLFKKLRFVLNDYFILSFSELMNKYNMKNK